MNNKRKLYEKRAEILTKKLLSRLYSMEAIAMENQLKVQKGIDKMNEKIDWDGRVAQLQEERDKLNERYQQMISASSEKWQEFSASFDDYFNQVNERRSDLMERANDWVEEANTWVNDMETRVVNYSQDLRTQYEGQIARLKDQRAVLSDKITKARSEGSDRFDQFRGDIENELKNLQNSLKGVMEHYRKDTGEQKEEGKA